MRASPRTWRFPLEPHELFALAYVIAGVIALERLPVSYPRRAIFLVYGTFALAVGAVAALSVLVRRSWKRRWGRGAARLSLGAELATLLRAGAILIPLLSVHFLLKSFIHLFNPRVWDRQLAALDVRLHLGIDPAEFLTTLFAQKQFLRALDLLYSGLYFSLLVVYVALLLTLLPARRRLAFTAAFALLWVLGSALYLALPSWGPVFVTPETFAATLAHMPLTVSVQQILYGEISSLVSNPLAPRLIRYGCVAAFPSLHVAVFALFTFASRGVSRRLSLATAGILVLMVLGSVITGYHYLVDAWAGIALAALVWLLARWVYRDGLAVGAG
ncbi:MAG: phosphatase PAP2 family protein [Acidobacteriota bacterium]